MQIRKWSLGGGHSFKGDTQRCNESWGISSEGGKLGGGEGEGMRDGMGMEGERGTRGEGRRGRHIVEARRRRKHRGGRGSHGDDERKRDGELAAIGFLADAGTASGICNASSLPPEF